MGRISKLIKAPFLRFQKLSKNKKIIVIIIVIGLTIGIWQYLQNKKQDIYITEKAKIGSITEIVSETGNIETSGKTDVYSVSTGIIDEIKVKNKDIVKKGEELFKVKSTATVQEQQAAYANYLAAKTTLDTAMSSAYDLRSNMLDKWKTFYDLATNSTYENSDKTPKKDTRMLVEFQTAQDDWLYAEKEYKDQQSVIAQAQASVSSTWLLYQATQNATILAQADGTIANLSVTLGDNVKAYSPTSLTNKPVLAIANYSRYVIKVSLGETDIYKINVDQEVNLQFDSFKNKKYYGTVTRIDDIGTNENGVIKYNIYIEVKNPDNKLKPGMTVDADIVTNKLDNIVIVPNSSVKPYKNGKAVRIVNKNTSQIEYIPVEIGIKGDKYTQIVKGINEGQEIVTSLKNEQVKRKGMFGF